MSWHHRLIHRAARLYWRVCKPRTLGVRAIVLDETDRVALVRHTYSDLWYLPGGGVKKGESFETALHRELKEEIAFSNARVERVLGIYHSRRDGKDDHIVIFAVRVADSTALQRADLMEYRRCALVCDGRDAGKRVACHEPPPGRISGRNSWIGCLVTTGRQSLHKRAHADQVPADQSSASTAS